LTDYIVSTDDNKIKKISEKFKAEVPFLRPKKYSTDKATSSDALRHAVLFMERKNKKKYDFIIELMVTNPLKKVEDIDSVIFKLISTKSDSVIAMSQIIEQHPRRLKKIINDRIVDIFPEKKESRRQDLKPKVYIRAGSIYGMKRNILMDKGLRYGTKNSRPYILLEERSVNIDSEKDFILAEHMMNIRGKRFS
jgi:CMP-N-acetylneuraminic acid synthetase